MAKNVARNNPTIDTLRERMSKDPFSRAFLQLAEEYRRTGQYDEAVKVCLEGLSRHPSYHTARISLGRTYLEAGDLESARRTLAEVLDLMPENHLAGKLLAEVQRRTGDLQGAAETYRGILRHYPADREIETLLRDLQAPAVDYLPEDLAAGAPSAGPAAAAPEAAGPAEVRVAIGTEARAPAEDPDADALQTNTLAELYLRQGLVDKAIEVYRAMLRVDPSNQRARRRLGDLAPGPAAAAPPAGRPAAEAVPVLPVTPPGAGEGTRRDKVVRLERWLRGFRPPGGTAAGAGGA